MIERLPRGQFRQLEHECGGRLFERTGRGVVLTELRRRPMKNAKRFNTWEQDARQMLTASNEEEGLDQRDSSISRAACGLATSARTARRNSS
jgi:DNA-binding transcriptional LysR family regulator